MQVSGGSSDLHQFQSFSQYRAKLKNKTADELALLAECGGVWNVLSVLNYLKAMVDNSDVVNKFRVAALSRGAVAWRPAGVVVVAGPLLRAYTPGHRVFPSSPTPEHGPPPRITPARGDPPGLHKLRGCIYSTAAGDTMHA